MALHTDDGYRPCPAQHKNLRAIPLAVRTSHIVAIDRVGGWLTNGARDDLVKEQAKSA